MIQDRTVTLGDQTTTIGLRNGTTDLPLFEQIFTAQVFSLARLKRAAELNKFYSFAVQMGWTPLIIDLGANIGLSALYFSMIWPKAKVLAVEPEAANYVRLLANIESRPQIVPYQKAASCRSESVEISNPDTDSVGFQTQAASGGGISTVTVPELLEHYPLSAGFLPFMIKVDIEGYESVLFEENVDWIDAFPLMTIELHDWALPGKGTSKSFLKAIAGRDRDFVYLGENVFSIPYRLSLPI